jgi:hypothetical protein
MPNSDVSAVQLSPPGSIGGRSGRGTIRLNYPAPDGGLALSLTASHPAVSVPPVVTVPAGGASAEFTFSTSAVAADVSASIGVASPRSHVDTPLQVWAVLPNFLSVTSEGEQSHENAIARLTPANAGMVGWCYDSYVAVRFYNFESGTWTVTLGAPTGTPLRPGTYENAQVAFLPGSQRTWIDVDGTGTCDSSVGRFVIHEVQVDRVARVRKLWATFEQTCHRNGGLLRGDVRATDIGLPPWYVADHRCTIN